MQVAILAHTNRDCLDDLVANVAAYVPEADVVVFNGGRDQHFLSGLEVDVCPFSQPLRKGNLVPFHIGVMRWLATQAADYEFLVLLDSDMLFVRSGFHRFLREQMSSSEFMAYNFRMIENLRPRDWEVVRHFCASWRWRWQPLFGTERPATSLNAGMIMRREYVEKVLRFPRTERILATAARSRVYGIEEILFSTFAVAVGANPIPNPGTVGIRFDALSPADVRSLAADPDVYLVHKIPLEIGDAGRVTVRELRGQPAPVSATPLVSRPSAPARSDSPGSRDRVRARLKDAYFHLFP